MPNRSNSIPLTEARRRLAELVDRLSQGEEFVITRRGVEVARLVPVSGPNRQETKQAIARMRAQRRHRRAKAAEIIAWKSFGRP